VIGNAVHVMRIATGEVIEGAEPDADDKAVVRRAGRNGGRAREKVATGDESLYC
jgi:hypothetical protein